MGQYLGLYTIGNAAIHLGFAAAASRIRHVSRDVLYLLTALVLTFVTIAIPVQFDGNRITLIWTAEALFLFWMGRARRLPLFEFFSFPLMALATLSLFSDWVRMYELRNIFEFTSIAYPVLNGVFLTGICYVAAFAGIWIINKNDEYDPVLSEDFRRLICYAVAAVGLFVLYNTFRNEIDNFYQYRMVQAAVRSLGTPDEHSYRQTNHDLDLFNKIWQINYTMLFVSVLSFIDIRKVKDRIFSVTNVVLGVLALAIFITGGLYILGELRGNYLAESGAAVHDSFNIVIRYVSYLFAAGLIAALNSYLKSTRIHDEFGYDTSIAAFDFIFHFSLLAILSCELVTWMDLLGYPNSDKFGMSILWGAYALALVALGIYTAKQYLRIGAIVLLGITLAKLFLYDISELSTIARTVVFVSLGILMLIVSFLYNKYKSVIFGPNEGT